MSELATPADDNDVLLWPDNFWCFRDELPKHFLRTQYFRPIPAYCLEWHHITYGLVLRLVEFRAAVSLVEEKNAEVVAMLARLEMQLADLKEQAALHWGVSPKEPLR